MYLVSYIYVVLLIICSGNLCPIPKGHYSPVDKIGQRETSHVKTRLVPPDHQQTATTLPQVNRLLFWSQVPASRVNRTRYVGRSTTNHTRCARYWHLIRWHIYKYSCGSSCSCLWYVCDIANVRPTISHNPRTSQPTSLLKPIFRFLS